MKELYQLEKEDPKKFDLISAFLTELSTALLTYEDYKRQLAEGNKKGVQARR